MKKQILGMVFILTLLCFPIAVNAATSGTWGDNVTWSLDNGTLTISGTGDMYNSDMFDSTPWYGSLSSIKKVVIEQGVTSVGDYAFQECANLTSVTIPDSVTSIGDGAFYYCSGLTSVTIPDTVTSIGTDAFYGSGYYNNSTNWIDGILYIDNCLINAKQEIRQCSIKNNCRLIAASAFFGCYNLTSITIPAAVTSIGENVFSGSGLTSINVDNQNQYYCSMGGNLFDKNKETLIKYAQGKEAESYTIPTGVTSIGDNAFAACRYLTSVTIPTGVTSIGDGAFDYCSELTSVTIPAGVTSIGGHAFSQCSRLTSITIPDSVTSIGINAFIGSGYYNNSANWMDGILYIDNCLISAKQEITQCSIKNNCKLIADYAFNSSTGLTSITIPGSVTSIGYNAFGWRNALTDVYYSGSRSEWNSITIGKYNDGLLNATIHYGKFDSITPVMLTATPSGDDYILIAETENDGTAYAAVYDAQGRLLSVVSTLFTDGKAVVTPDTTGGKYIKFFVWTNIAQPVTNVKNLDL